MRQSERSERRRRAGAKFWLAGGWIALLATAASATPLLTLELGSQGASGSAVAGQPLTVTVIAADVPAGSDGAGLFGFGFTLTVSSGAASFSNIMLGNDWTGAASIAVDVDSLSITANRVTENSGPFGARVVLAQFELTLQTPGSYTLSLGSLTGPGDNVLFDGTELDAQAGFFGSGSLTVAPEPSLVGLLAGALLALGAAGAGRRFVQHA